MSSIVPADVDFRRIFSKTPSHWIAAGLYEYARESEAIRDTCRRWLEAQETRRALETLAQTLERFKNKTLAFALSLYEGSGTPPSLRNQYFKLLEAERAMQQIEARARSGAPRLRNLAIHLVNDLPWLRIPEQDRCNAIAAGFESDEEVPVDEDGATFICAMPPVRRVDWVTFSPPKFTAKQIEAGEDQRFRIIHHEKGPVGILPGDEDLLIRIKWGNFTNERIARAFENWVCGPRARPTEWKHLAKGSGHRKDNWWRAALKELAAMRLVHELAPDAAVRKFRVLYSLKGFKLDEPNFRKLRRQAIQTFRYLFDTADQPRHALTYRQRNQRVGNG